MNVEELLNSRDIQFQPKGNDYIVRCLNDDHEDRHPSMRIDKITGIFNCFSCGFKGNIFTHFGERPNELQMRREMFKKKLNNKRAESIGLHMPVQTIPYEGDWRNIKPDTYKAFEAFQSAAKEYVGRIMFPIRNISGRIVAFNGRHTGQEVPKYLISPAGAKLPLFPVVKPYKGTIILVEGLFDMLNMHDKGLTHTVCCFGTNNISEDKLAMLKIQGVESIDIFFDGDEPGQKAAEKVKNLCEKLGLPSRNICLEGSDPGALTQNQVDKLARKL